MSNQHDRTGWTQQGVQGPAEYNKAGTRSKGGLFTAPIHGISTGLS